MEKFMCFFLVTVLIIIGCGEENQRKAAIKSASAKSSETYPLNAEEINKLFVFKKQSPGKFPDGRVYQVNGIVDNVSIIDDKPAQKNESGIKGYVRVLIYLPEYAAGSIECNFEMTHKANVEALKKGDKLKVKGVLGTNFRLLEGDRLYLNGCTIENK
jgi:hypothetical protein